MLLLPDAMTALHSGRRGIAQSTEWLWLAVAGRTYFAACRQGHSRCYSACIFSRATCDQALLGCMQHRCGKMPFLVRNACDVGAKAFVGLVQAFGEDDYAQAQAANNCWLFSWMKKQ